MSNLRSSLVNFGYFFAGILFMTLAFAKNKMGGYTTPASLEEGSSENLERTIDTVRSWIRGIEAIGLDRSAIAGADVLELGPGSKLGTGALLLALGAKSYTAYDKFALVADSASYYERILNLAQDEFGYDVDVSKLAQRIADRDPSLVRYVVEDSFDFSALNGPWPKPNLVFSMASFEHFDDCDAVVQDLTEVCSADAKLVSYVDFQTHSRWIRRKDPNNIYRYPDWLYGLFAFPGSCNRMRPVDFIDLFRKHGWKRADLGHTKNTTGHYHAATTPFLAKQFRGATKKMEVLSGAIVAER